MFRRMSVVGYEAANGLHRFICDDATDLANLPTLTEMSTADPICGPCNVGSTAIVIDETKEYMLNNQGEWVLFRKLGSGSSLEDIEE